MVIQIRNIFVILLFIHHQFITGGHYDARYRYNNYPRT